VGNDWGVTFLRVARAGCGTTLTRKKMALLQSAAAGWPIHEHPLG